MLRRLIILILWLAAPAFALTTISVCGVTANIPSEVYQITGNLTQTGNGNCIEVTATGVEIDGQGFSIDHDGVAIRLTGTVTGFNIHDIAFTTSAYNGAGDWSAIRKLTGGFSGTLHNNTFTANVNEATANYIAIRVTNGLNGLFDVHSNTGTLENTGTNGRIQWLSGMDVSGASSQAKIRNNTITLRAPNNSNESQRSQINQINLVNTSPNVLEVFGNNYTIGNSGAPGGNSGAQAISIFCGSGEATSAVFTANNNTITDYGAFSRLLHEDYCDNSEIHSNTVTLAGTGLSSAIRIRYHSKNNEVYLNTIDAAACTGCQRLIYIGENAGASSGPIDTIVRDNVITGVGQGVQIFHIFEESDGTRIFNNSATLRSDGTGGVFVHVQDVAKPITDVEVAFNKFTNNSANTTPFDFLQNPANITGFAFCANDLDGGGNVAAGDVSDSDPGDGEPTFTTSPCLCETEALGCGAPAGARSTGDGNTRLSGSVLVSGRLVMQ